MNFKEMQRKYLYLTWMDEAESCEMYITKDIIRGPYDC